ncbi:ISAzo13-like element transposase-related protein [Microcystis aeruginosa]|jgi:hypothetical protein|uniref:ISAzo13-like element transposase-related protein n=1 Tax=Microcystis aeruginosa TaxID=1126 RepID=UPI00030661AA
MDKTLILLGSTLAAQEAAWILRGQWDGCTYYPPYHSKYNAVERTFGWLEQHWNGSLLDSVETVLRFAESLTFKGKNPVVKLIDKVYRNGVKLTQEAMAELEKPKYRTKIVGNEENPDDWAKKG